MRKEGKKIKYETFSQRLVEICILNEGFLASFLSLAKV